MCIDIYSDTTSGLGVMSRFASVVAIAPLWADWAETLISSPRFLVYQLAKFLGLTIGLHVRFTAEK